jgi:hypothetical protein
VKTFRVYRHLPQELQAVKVGFSWPAFFFVYIWMAVKNLWGLAAMWFAAYAALFLVEEAIDTNQGVVNLMLTAGYLAVSLVPGFKGNSWRESNLVRRGYELVAQIRAETPEAAAAKSAQPNVQQSDSYTQHYFTCERCQHRISHADAAWDRLVADRRCPSCHLPAALS